MAAGRISAQMTDPADHLSSSAPEDDETTIEVFGGRMHISGEDVSIEPVIGEPRVTVHRDEIVDLDFARAARLEWPMAVFLSLALCFTLIPIMPLWLVISWFLVLTVAGTAALGAMFATDGVAIHLWTPERLDLKVPFGDAGINDVLQLSSWWREGGPNRVGHGVQLASDSVAGLRVFTDKLEVETSAGVSESFNWSAVKDIRRAQYYLGFTSSRGGARLISAGLVVLVLGTITWIPGFHEPVVWRVLIGGCFIAGSMAFGILGIRAKNDLTVVMAGGASHVVLVAHPDRDSVIRHMVRAHWHATGALSDAGSMLWTHWRPVIEADRRRGGFGTTDWATPSSLDIPRPTDESE